MNQLIIKKSRIEDDFVLTNKVLGEGVNGKVLACIHRLTKEKFAVKPLKDSKKAREEIYLHWRASHECNGVVQIKDIYENFIEKINMLFVVMECIDGGELFEKVSKNIVFKENEIAKIMFEIFLTIKHLHSINIVHGDLKLENVLLSTAKNNPLVKICDFGCAKEINDSKYTKGLSKDLESEDYNLADDMWSLGVIMYALCCKKYPNFYYPPGHEASNNKKKSGQFSLVDKCWKKFSEDSKNLLKNLLEADPDSRIGINEALNSNWITKNLK